MLFKSFPPSDPLSLYVQTYQVRHFLINPRIKSIPKPYVVRPEETIAFYVRGREKTRIISQNKILVRPRATLTGQWTARIDRWSLENEFLMVQVILKPGGVYKLTGIPSYELADKCIDLSDIYPVAVRTLFNRFDEEINYEEIIKAIEKFLEELFGKSRLQHHLFEKAFTLLGSDETVSISKLAGQACLSIRQFERKALNYLGVPCSTYQRIARFAESFKLKTKNPGKAWTDVAIQSGYYDYQHLVRDYKSLAFTNPRVLFDADQVSLEKLLKLGDGYS